MRLTPPSEGFPNHFTWSLHNQRELLMRTLKSKSKQKKKKKIIAETALYQASVRQRGLFLKYMYIKGK